MGSSLLFLRGARFKCLASGACCTRYDIPLGPTEKWTALRARPESPGALECITRPDLPDLTVLRGGQLGRCVFLRETDGLCAVHAENGLEEKPDACRLFPYGTVETPDGLVIYTMMECDNYYRTWKEGTPVHVDAADVPAIVERAGPGKRVGMNVPVGAKRTLPWRDYRRVEEIVLRALERADGTMPEVLGWLRDLAVALEETAGAPDPVGAALERVAAAPDRSADDPEALAVAARAFTERLASMRTLSLGSAPVNERKLAALDTALGVLAGRASGRAPALPLQPRIVTILENPPRHDAEAEPLRSFYREIFRQWVWSKLLASQGIVAGAFDLGLRWAFLGPIAQSAAAARGARTVELHDLNEAMIDVSLIARTLGPVVTAPLRQELDAIWRKTDVLLFLSA